MHAQLLSHIQLSVTPWTIAHQAPLSIEFSSQEHWGGLHFLLQGIFSTQGSNLRLSCPLHWQADSYYWATWEALKFTRGIQKQIWVGQRKN